MFLMPHRRSSILIGATARGQIRLQHLLVDFMDS